MGDIRGRLDAAAARLEALEADIHENKGRIDAAEKRRAELGDEARQLRSQVIERADELYRSGGGTGLIETLLEAKSFSQLSDRAEILSRVSLRDSALFVRLARAQADLARVTRELASRREQLTAAARSLKSHSDRLQQQFKSVRGEYLSLQKQLAARAQAAAVEVVPSSQALVFRRPRGKMACPVAGPVSFVDTWGAPRSGGRRHQGVDMMAAYGTPVVAIVSGSITFAGYGGSAGHWQILTGNDGNAYWYMHNQRNLVSGGRVSAGQQIAEVGDTGNAEGTPHLHFEYHPGGGGAVNPYPLVASIC